jgi:hypothetical protein
MWKSKRGLRRFVLAGAVATAGAAAAAVFATSGKSDRDGRPSAQPAGRVVSRQNAEFAFDCAPPHPGPLTSIGDTLCVGTRSWRLRFPVLGRIHVEASANSPQWSPDGQRLLFRLARSRGMVERDDVAMIALDGTSYVNLTDAPQRGNWGATWSPDGRQIVVNAFKAGVNAQVLFIMNADGSGLRQLTHIWGEYAQWSPDGELIAFQSNRCSCNGPDGEGAYDIYVIRPDGSSLRRLTDLVGEESVAGWSPDGRLLGYGRNPDAHPGVWVIPRDGGQPLRHLVPEAPGVQLRGASWEPDGTWFFFAVPRGSSPLAQTRTFVYRASEDGAKVEKLLDDAGGASLRPKPGAKALSHLTLSYRWRSPHRLRLSGSLTVGGTAASGRRVIIGRLGTTLPTKRLAAVVTGPNGKFSLALRGPNRSAWRVATAYFDGSSNTWSTTAFARMTAAVP